MTLPIVGLGAAAVKVAIDFETAFAGVEKTVNGTAAEIAGLRDGIQQMSRRLPASTTQIAAVAEAAGQLGIQTDKILGFSEVMIGLGEATNLSATQAATSLARLANITGLPQDQFSNLGSAIVDLGNNFATTEAEIVEIGLRLAGAGRIAGLTEGQILGLGAALSSVGIDAEAGGTAFSKVLIQIREAAGAGGQALADFARVSGLTSSEFQALVKNNPAQAIAAFVEGLGRIEASGGSATQTLSALGIAEVRMRDALLRTAQAGDLVARAMNTGSTAFAENAALAAEVSKRYDTLASRLAVVRNRLTAAVLPLGEVLAGMLEDSLPAIEGMLGGLQRLAEGFRALPGPMQLAIVSIAAVTAAIGPLLLGLSAMIAIAPYVAGAWALITGPVGLTVAALAGVAAIAVVVASRFDELAILVRAKWALIKGEIVGAVGSIVDALTVLSLATDRALLGMSGGLSQTSIQLFGLRARLDEVQAGARLDFTQAVGEFNRLRVAASDAADALRDPAFLDAFAASQRRVLGIPEPRAPGVTPSGATPLSILPTGDADADKVRTVIDVFKDLQGQADLLREKLRLGFDPIEIAAARAAQLGAAFEEAFALNNNTLTPQIEELGRAALAAAEYVESIRDTPLPTLDLSIPAVDLEAPALGFDRLADAAGRADLSLNFVRRAVGELDAAFAAARTDQERTKIAALTAVYKKMGDRIERLRTPVLTFGKVVTKLGREIAADFARAVGDAFATLVDGILFGTSQLSAAERRLAELDFAAEGERLREMLGEGQINAERFSAEMAVLNERMDRFHASFSPLTSALRSFGDFFRRVFINLIAQLTTAIALAALLRVLFPQATAAQGFGGLVLGALGGGGLKAPTVPPANVQTPSPPPVNKSGPGGYEIAFGMPVIRNGGFWTPAYVVAAANRAGNQQAQRLGLHPPGYAS